MRGKSGKQMTMNLLASILSFGINMAINFFLTPILIRELGAESYGFIGLANNFVQYASIITVALNSMSGRFISISYHKGERKKAEKIFNSVLIADIIMAAFMLLLTSFFTAYLDIFLDVPVGLVKGVKITFGITFFTFVLSIITSIFTTSTFVKNRVDINAVRDIGANLVKIAVIITMFTLFDAQLYFIALASLISGTVLLISTVGIKKKLMPEIRVDVKNHDFKLVREIMSAGIWMSLAQLSNVLISGVDLLICNVMIGSVVMGLLSVAKTIPHCISSLIASLGSVFTPHYTILYAKNDIKGLVKEVNLNSRILSFLLTVPIAGFIAFGKEFYTLWQPTYTEAEIGTIQLLSVLTCISYLFTVHTQCMTMLNSVCNKMKIPVLVSLGVGITGVVVTISILSFSKMGDNGVYVIAGTSSILMSLRAFFFVPLYSAHILDQKWNTFFPSMIRGWITFFILLCIDNLIGHFIRIDGWFIFIAACILAAAVGYIASFLLLFDKNERNTLKNFSER